MLTIVVYITVLNSDTRFYEVEAVLSIVVYITVLNSGSALGVDAMLTTVVYRATHNGNMIFVAVKIDAVCGTVIYSTVCDVGVISILEIEGVSSTSVVVHTTIYDGIVYIWLSAPTTTDYNRLIFTPGYVAVHNDIIMRITGDLNAKISIAYSTTYDSAV